MTTWTPGDGPIADAIAGLPDRHPVTIRGDWGELHAIITDNLWATHRRYQRAELCATCPVQTLCNAEFPPGRRGHGHGPQNRHHTSGAGS